MASPHEKLAESLEVLRTLQKNGVVAVRSGDLSQKVIQGLPDLASLPPRLHWVSPLKKDRCV